MFFNDFFHFLYENKKEERRKKKKQKKKGATNIIRYDRNEKKDSFSLPKAERTDINFYFRQLTNMDRS